jgi:hypothetical protein
MMLSVICASDDNMMIQFSGKRCLSVSTTRAIRTPDRGAKKFGSLKDFEVRNIQEKKLEINGWELLSRSGQSSTRSRK